MKAHISMTSAEKNRVQKDIKLMVKQQLFEEREQLMRKFFKLSVATLHNEYGFGQQRAFRYIEKVAELIKESDEDEIFWEHLDKLVIDRLGLPFERDWTR